ncbi:MAG: ABC transporter ATP-binding protein [Limnobacter sp.]|uniref:ABC transporter ATP-binding protein n=1 Tax=Limnobacter sp. TaxID=2003368 RepID=UPI00391CDF76
MSTIAPSPPLLACQELAYAWGECTALNKVSLNLNAGQLTGLLGPNGAGKTTLISLLAGLLQPASGTIWLGGEALNQLGPVARTRMGFVFQSVSLDRFMTVQDNLHFAGGLQGMGREACSQRIAALNSVFPLAPLLKRSVASLSGGQRRLVDIARALMHNPALLVLDEPTTALDVPSKHTVWQTLNRLKCDTGLTILVATHLMDEASTCDQVVFLREGAVQWSGTPEQALDQLPDQRMTTTRHATLADWFVWAMQQGKPL